MLLMYEFLVRIEGDVANDFTFGQAADLAGAAEDVIKRDPWWTQADLTCKPSLRTVTVKKDE